MQLYHTYSMNTNETLFNKIVLVENEVGDLTTWWANEAIQDVEINQDNIERIQDIVKDLKGILQDIEPVLAQQV